MQCAESLRVQAYFDREVDAVSAAEIERHVEHCNECRELLQDLEKVRSALRSGISYASAPPALRAQVLQALDRFVVMFDDFLVYCVAIRIGRAALDSKEQQRCGGESEYVRFALCRNGTRHGVCPIV